MSNQKFLKKGMGGSNNGRSRAQHTEVLKKESKKVRKKQGKVAIRKELAELAVFAIIA